MFEDFIAHVHYRAQLKYLSYFENLAYSNNVVDIYSYNDCFNQLMESLASNNNLYPHRITIKWANVGKPLIKTIQETCSNNSIESVQIEDSFGITIWFKNETDAQYFLMKYYS